MMVGRGAVVPRLSQLGRRLLPVAKTRREEATECFHWSRTVLRMASLGRCCTKRRSLLCRVAYLEKGEEGKVNVRPGREQSESAGDRRGLRVAAALSAERRLLIPLQGFLRSEGRGKKGKGEKKRKMGVMEDMAPYFDDPANIQRHEIYGH